MIISLQRDLRIDLMPATERNRWVDNEICSTTCRKIVEGLAFIILAAFLIFGMIAVVSYGEWTVFERKTITWLMTLLPSFLYFVMELLVWRTKQSWTNATVSSSSDEREAELPTDEENPPAEIVSSPVHSAPNDNDDDDGDNTTGIELPETPRQAPAPQRNPPMIKTQSSRPPIPVRTLAAKLEEATL